MIYGNILQAIGNAPLVRLNLNLKIFLSIFLFPQFFYTNANSQPVQTNSDTLNLTDSGRKIENSISLFISRSDYQAIKATTGGKVTAKPLSLIINGDSVNANTVNTRGQTTLLYRRKSFSFDLKSKAQFRHGEKAESFKRFFVLSLSMDRNYCNNRLAFEMMETLGLFSLFYSYCELRINGRSEGIYLVVERPEDWAVKKKNSPLLIRRGYDHNIDKIVMDKFIFSAEDLPDAKIASDTYLHSVYIIQFSEVLNQLSTGVLKKVFESTYAELYPYYSTNEIISMSEYDAYKYANFERLQNDMFALYNQLRFSRDFFMENLRKK